VGLLDLILGAIAPPLCVACRRSADEVLCPACAAELTALRAPEAPPPPGIDAVWAAAAHDGVARELIAALKFRSLLACVEPIAVALAAAPPELLDGVLVPVLPSPARLRRRGFDPAYEIAAALAERRGLELAPCLARGDGPRQVGRPRRERIARPPAVRLAAPAPPSAVLLDDVQTTGATLAACAAALRRGGALRVTALTFARAP
jgi:predicted amidophosphoribosyltransferase